MPEARVEIDDEALYERVTSVKDKLGATWKGLVVQGAIRLSSDAGSLGVGEDKGEITPSPDEILYLHALKGGKRHVKDIADVVSTLERSEHPPDTVQQQLNYLSQATEYVEQADESGTFRLTREGEIALPFRESEEGL